MKEHFTNQEGPDAAAFNQIMDELKNVEECRRQKDDRFASKGRPVTIDKIKEAVMHLQDDVNSPSHYTQGGIETIDCIQAALTPEEYRGYLKGNILKYIHRERHKGQTESLMKAEWYLKRLIQFDKTNPTQLTLFG